jgi:membrane protease YdiL (CAAX protease family)
VARRTDRIGAVVRSRPVLTFVCVTLLISWGIWWPVAFGLVKTGPIEKIGGLAPTIAGLVLTAVLTGEQGLRDLGRRLVDWRAGLGWYLLALAFSPVLLLLAVVSYRALGGSLALSIPDPPILIIGFVYVLVTSVAGEEIGLRGFALPRLQLWAHSILSPDILPGKRRASLPFSLQRAI